MKNKLEGIVPPLVTPLLNDNTLDLEGLEKLIEHVIAGGVHGVFILGTTGEAQSLGFELRVEMIKQTSGFLKGRLPLLVGISDTSVADSIRLAQHAHKFGAYAVVSAPPYYFATGQPELQYFYEQLIAELPLPLFLYNMPTHTKVSFSVETIQALAKNEKVIGFKDSSANGAYFQSIMYAMRDRSDFSIFVGPEEMTAEVVLLGASGGVNGGANLYPKLYVDLYNAAKNRDIDKIKVLQQKVMQVCATIYSNGKYGSSYLKGLKSALSVAGICSDVLASPFEKFDKTHRKIVEKAVKNMNL